MMRSTTTLFLAALLVPQPLLADVAVKGLVGKPASLSLAALRAMPVTHVTATQATSHGASTLDCSGVAISTLLDAAQPQYGTAKNARLAHTLLFTADDGYQAALAVAETDPFPGHTTPILATACNGRDLDAPRLIVPADAGAGRAVNGVVSMELKK